MMRRFVLLLTLVGAGCGYTQLAPPPDDVGPGHVWIYRGELWGRQCEVGGPPKPDVRGELERVGVEVVLFKEEGRGVCRACGCPSGSSIFYALIPRSQLDTAKQLGFMREYGFERGLSPSDPVG